MPRLVRPARTATSASTASRRRPCSTPLTRQVYAADALGRGLRDRAATGDGRADVAPPGPAGEPALGAPLGRPRRWRRGSCTCRRAALCPGAGGRRASSAIDLSTSQVREPSIRRPRCPPAPAAWGGGGVAIDAADRRRVGRRRARRRGRRALRRPHRPPVARPRGRSAARPAHRSATAATRRRPCCFQPAGCPRLVMALARSGRLDVLPRRPPRRPAAGARRPRHRGDGHADLGRRQPPRRSCTLRGCPRVPLRPRVPAAHSRGGASTAAPRLSIVAAGGVGVAAVRDLRLLQPPQRPPPGAPAVRPRGRRRRARPARRRRRLDRDRHDGRLRVRLPRPGALSGPQLGGGAHRRDVVGDAPGTNRTCDLCLRRAALYPLSYGRAARAW